MGNHPKILCPIDRNPLHRVSVQPTMQEELNIEFHTVDATPPTWFGDIDGNIFVVISRDSEGFAWVVSDTRIPGDCEMLRGHEPTLIEAKEVSSKAARDYNNKSKSNGKDN